MASPACWEPWQVVSDGVAAAQAGASTLTGVLRHALAASRPVPRVVNAQAQPGYWVTVAEREVMRIKSG